MVFSHPPIGSVGLTEDQARAEYGDDKIKVYTSNFVNLYYGPWQVRHTFSTAFSLCTASGSSCV